MKYMEIVMLIVCINLGITAANEFCLIPSSNGGCLYKGYVLTFDEKGLINSTNFASATYMTALDVGDYSRSAVTTIDTNTLLQGDFLTGTFAIAEILGRSITDIGPTLTILAVNQRFHFLVITVVSLAYLMAFIEMITGRTLEASG